MSFYTLSYNHLILYFPNVFIYQCLQPMKIYIFYNHNMFIYD